MRILDAETVSSHLEGLVHLDTQRAPAGIDLTVAELSRVTGAGRLDFGGSEFEPAPRDRIAPELASPDDDYGWWKLEAGSYVIRYNETLGLPSGRLALVHPLPRLLRAGASHPAFVHAGEVGPGGEGPADGRIETLLTVGEGGCELKENCRVSRLLVLQASREGR